MIKRRKIILFKKIARINKCKDTLDELQKKGYVFSEEIYNELDDIEDKIFDSVIIHSIWKHKQIFFSILIIIFSSYFIGMMLITTDEISYINEPPIILDHLPVDKAIVNFSLSRLMIEITDNESDKFNWSIETSPHIGRIKVIDDENGIKYCEISNLVPNTEYTWFVNITDGNHWTHKTYHFFTPSESYYIPTVATMKIQVTSSRNILQGRLNVKIIPSFETIKNWTKKDNKVAIKYEIINPNKVTFNSQFKFKVRIGEWQEDNYLPFLLFLLDTGHIKMKNPTRWLTIGIDIPPKNYEDVIFIDVELYTFEKDVTMLTYFWYFNIHSINLYFQTHSVIEIDF